MGGVASSRSGRRCWRSTTGPRSSTRSRASTANRSRCHIRRGTGPTPCSSRSATNASAPPGRGSPRYASFVPEDERRVTDSGIEVEPLYQDVDRFEPATELGRPGEPPFTRGVYPNMYRGRLWTMRQYAGMATAEETNTRFRYLLEHG